MVVDLSPYGSEARVVGQPVSLFIKPATPSSPPCSLLFSGAANSLQQFFVNAPEAAIAHDEYMVAGMSGACDCRNQWLQTTVSASISAQGRQRAS